MKLIVEFENRKEKPFLDRAGQNIIYFEVRKYVLSTLVN